MNDLLIFAPIVFPSLGASILFFAKVIRHRMSNRMLSFFGMCIGLLPPLIAIGLLFQPVAQGLVSHGIIGRYSNVIGISYQFDHYSFIMYVITFSVGIICWIYGWGMGLQESSFSIVFLILLSFLSTTAITSDIFTLFVSLEVLGLTSYVLISTAKKGGASFASFSYLLGSSTAMVFFLLGVFGLYKITGSLSYTHIAESMQQLHRNDVGTIIVSFAFMTAAILLRVAIIPLHSWLPQAHALAPHPVSALLSGILLKIPLIALLRFILIFPFASDMGLIIGFGGAITACVGVCMALAQKDAKQLLAYHSISQIGYIACAWGIALHVGLQTPIGIALMAGSCLHAFYHAQFKSLLFLSMGTTIDCIGKRNIFDLMGASYALRLSGEKFPLTTISFFIGALSIAAIPPLNGFASKAFLTYPLKQSILYGLLTVASVGTVASFIKLSRIYWPAQHSHLLTMQKSISTIHSRHHWARLFSQSLHSILCIASGIASPWIYEKLVILLSEADSAVISINLYSQDTMIKTILTIAFGLILFLFVVSKWGKRVCTTMCTWRAYDQLSVMYIISSALLVLVLMFGIPFLQHVLFF